MQASCLCMSISRILGCVEETKNRVEIAIFVPKIYLFANDPKTAKRGMLKFGHTAVTA